MLGWKVEWSSSFRRYEGVVIKESSSELIIYSFDDAESFTIIIPDTRVIKIRPDCWNYVRFAIRQDYKSDWQRHHFVESVNKLLNQLPTQDKIMKIEIERTRKDKNFLMELIDFCVDSISSEPSATLDEANSSIVTTRAINPEFNCTLNSNASSISPVNRISVRSTKASSGFNRSCFSSAKDTSTATDNSDDEDPENRSDDDESENEDDEDDGEDDDEEDDSEEKSDESSSNSSCDDSSTADERTEAADSDSDKETSDVATPVLKSNRKGSARGKKKSPRMRNDPQKLQTVIASVESKLISSSASADDSSGFDDCMIDFKVVVIPSRVVRGFSLRCGSAFMGIISSLQTDYGEIPSLSYEDPEGDVVSIVGQRDFVYAIRTHIEFHQSKTKHEIGSNLSLDQVLRQIPKLRLSANIPMNIQSTRVVADVPNGVLLSPGGEIVVPNFPRAKLGGESQKTDSVDIAVPSGTLTAVSVKQEAGQAPSAELMWQRGEVLGSGSFGQVFSGIDLNTGRRMAVKEVTLGGSRKERDQAYALQQEVRILCKLRHPNIIRYFGTEYSKTTMRIFLELAPEGSVKDTLTEFGALAEAIIRRYTLDIVSGLAYLHTKKIIHRDIKPSNLLISGGRIKLADFGCSSVSMDASTSERGHRTVAGTAVYMAPEVMMSSSADKELMSGVDTQGMSNVPLNGANPATLDRSGLDISQSIDGYYEHRRSGGEAWTRNIDSSDDVPTDSRCVTGKSSSFRHQHNEQKHPSRANPDGQPVLTPGDNNHENLAGDLKGYGRRADIWSLGITLVELATGKAPFRNGAAAIYAVCVSKEIPLFPERMSASAQNFLARCLVLNPKSRANCSELQAHPFIAKLRSHAPSNRTRSRHADLNSLEQHDDECDESHLVDSTRQFRDSSVNGNENGKFCVATSISTVTFEPNSTIDMKALLDAAADAEANSLFRSGTTAVEPGNIPKFNERPSTCAGSSRESALHKMSASPAVTNQHGRHLATWNPARVADDHSSNHDHEFDDILLGNIKVVANRRPSTCPTGLEIKQNPSANHSSDAEYTPGFGLPNGRRSRANSRIDLFCPAVDETDIPGLHSAPLAATEDNFSHLRENVNDCGGSSQAISIDHQESSIDAIVANRRLLRRQSGQDLDNGKQHVRFAQEVIAGYGITQSNKESHGEPILVATDVTTITPLARAGSNSSMRLQSVGMMLVNAVTSAASDRFTNSMSEQSGPLLQSSFGDQASESLSWSISNYFQ